MIFSSLNAKFYKQITLQIVCNYILNLTIISSMAKGKKGKNKQQATNVANQVTEPTNAQSKASDTVSQTSTQVGTENTMTEEKREVGQEEFSQNNSPKLQQGAKQEESLQEPLKVASVQQVVQPIVEVNSAEVRPNQNVNQIKLQEAISKPLIQEVVQKIENVVQAEPQRLLQKVQEISIKKENTIQKVEIIENQRISESFSGLQQIQTESIQILENTENIKIDEPHQETVLQTEEKVIVKKEEDSLLIEEELIQENQSIITEKKEIIDNFVQRIENHHESTISPILSQETEVQKQVLHQSSQAVVLLESQTIEEVKKQEIVQQRPHILESSHYQDISMLKEQTVQLTSFESSKRQEQKSKPAETNSDDAVIDLSKPIDLDSLSAPKIQEPIFTLAQSHDIQSESQKSENKSQVIREVEREIKIEASQSFSDLNYSVERDQIDPTRSQPVNIELHEHEVKQPQAQDKPLQSQAHADQRLRQVKSEIYHEVIKSESNYVEVLILHNQHSLQQANLDIYKHKQTNKQETKYIQVKIERNQEQKVQKDLTTQEHHQNSDAARQNKHLIEKVIEKVQVLVEDSNEELISQKIELLEAIEVSEQLKKEETREEQINDIRSQQKNEIKEEQRIGQIKEQPNNEAKEQSNIELINNPIEQIKESIQVVARQQDNKELIFQQPKVEQIKEEIKIQNAQKLVENNLQLELVQDKLQQNIKQDFIKKVENKPEAEQIRIDIPKEPIKPDNKKRKDDFGILGKISLSVGVAAVSGGAVWAFQKNGLRSLVAGLGTGILAYLIS